MRRFLATLGALSLLVVSPANAEWRQARTDHFVLLIDDTEAGARDFATRLERFDAAMRRLYSVPDNPDQHARPITIYLLKDKVFIEACGCPGVLGFYRPEAAGSLIMSAHMLDMDRKAIVGGWSSQAVLLHEYVHHFTYSNFPIAYPYWFSEGFAEFKRERHFRAGRFDRHLPCSQLSRRGSQVRRAAAQAAVRSASLRLR